MNKIAIVVGSTRPGRRADLVAQWVHNRASRRSDAEFEIVAIADYALPLMDEPTPPFYGPSSYVRAHTKSWSQTIAAFDGFVFVTPEYNQSTPAALKNAIDFLYMEWNDKAAGFVSYGAEGGVRAVEHLRSIVATVGLATVKSTVAITLHAGFDDMNRVLDESFREAALTAMLDEVTTWTTAMRAVRHPAESASLASTDLHS